MVEIGKVVTDNYPAEKLPEELRRSIEAGQKVRVTVEAEERNELPPLHELMGSAKGLFATPEEAVTFIRELRDEWE